jgi:hypothetical protein
MSPTAITLKASGELLLQSLVQKKPNSFSLFQTARFTRSKTQLLSSQSTSTNHFAFISDPASDTGAGVRRIGGRLKSDQGIKTPVAQSLHSFVYCSLCTVLGAIKLVQ